MLCVCSCKCAYALIHITSASHSVWGVNRVKSQLQKLQTWRGDDWALHGGPGKVSESQLTHLQSRQRLPQNSCYLPSTDTARLSQSSVYPSFL